MVDSMHRQFLDLAWQEFIRHARTEPDIVAQFKVETGRDLSAASTSFDALIDEVIGRRDDNLRAFVEWTTRIFWGIDYAPKAYRESLWTTS